MKRLVPLARPTRRNRSVTKCARSGDDRQGPVLEGGIACAVGASRCSYPGTWSPAPSGGGTSGEAVGGGDNPFVEQRVVVARIHLETDAVHRNGTRRDREVARACSGSRGIERRG